MGKEQPCHCCGGTGRENNHFAIGQGLRAKREGKNIKAKEVADAMNISAQYLHDLEVGRRYWTVDLIDSYNKAIA